MENIAEHLKNIKVLDNSDIIKFKNYICQKYPDNTAVKNAKILSDTIHKIIYVKLDGLPEDSKVPIKIETLKNTLGSSKNLITLYDIFNSCLINENLKDSFREQLANWVTSHTEIKVKVEELDLYLETDELKIVETTQILEEKNIEPDIIKSNQECVNVNVDKAKAFPYLNNLQINRCVIALIMCIFVIPLYGVSKNFSSNINKIEQKEEKYILQADKVTNISNKYPNAHLPQYMRYKTVNEEKLKNFLDKRKSLLASEPYFSTMISAAKEFNLNPIVLFSITGQEQAFVPKDKENASKIANNPFNVYHSWKEYNTNIKDSSRIASRTVINLAENMPENEDPFLWIGKKYAEDKYWGNGVKSIFKELSNSVN